jgi:arsenate reductase-like glutaredoxin family protein
MGVALKHHYQANSHHPEYYEAGVAGMTLLDLLEMLVDWKAATLRHTNGDLRRSLNINTERFHIDSQLKAILENTAMALGLLQDKASIPADSRVREERQ